MPQVPPYTTTAVNRTLSFAQLMKATTAFGRYPLASIHRVPYTPQWQPLYYQLTSRIDSQRAAWYRTDCLPNTSVYYVVAWWLSVFCEAKAMITNTKSAPKRTDMEGPHKDGRARCSLGCTCNGGSPC